MAALSGRPHFNGPKFKHEMGHDDPSRSEATIHRDRFSRQWRSAPLRRACYLTQIVILPAVTAPSFPRFENTGFS